MPSCHIHPKTVTKKSLTRILPLALLMILSLFGMLELSLRLYQAADPGFIITPDTAYLRFRGRPCSEEFNGFRLNSRGYKDLEFSEQKRPGRYRIVAIGDSQTYGAVPYGDSYMTLLENILQSINGETEILNLGIPQAGPVDYLSVLADEGFSLNPDMVLLHFNIFDDFKNGGTRRKLYSFSAAASWINGHIARIIKPDGVIFGAGPYREGYPLRSDEAYLQLLIDAHGTVFKKNNAPFNDDFRSSFDYISRICRACKKRNIALAVIIIPADLQLYPYLQKKALAALNAAEDDYDFKIPNRMLGAELVKRGIPYLDLMDYFLTDTQKAGKTVTQGNDPHWNRSGSRTAAEAVSSWLAGQVRLPVLPSR